MKKDGQTVELLSPAGDKEKLLMALCYGADAVYLAGKQFGMRASAGNFDSSQLKEAVQLCHSLGKRVYVTCNTNPREDELKQLPEFLSMLQEYKVDAAIVADFGVMRMLSKYAPDVKLHVSTQFGIVNSEAANALYDMGADTVVLARELSLREISEIRKNTPDDLKLEAFVHGAMCVSFSGRCLLSNYLTDRDANRGECAQPCRWSYSLCEANNNASPLNGDDPPAQFALAESTRPGEYFPIFEDKGTFILNSRDMCMITHLRELVETGISSLKIEGRMKSSYYNAVITNAYRHALDAVLSGRDPERVWLDETEMVSHRPYSTGFYYGYPGQHYAQASYITGADVMAVVQECDSDGNALLVQRGKFETGDELQLVTPTSPPVSFIAGEITDIDGITIPDTRHAAMLFRLKLPAQAPELSLLRRVRKDNAQ